jgi:phage terminase large subunit GpA-like protein
MIPNDIPAEELQRADQLVSDLMAQFLAPPPRVDVAEWSDLYRHIAKGPERGPWRNSRTPYLVEPMECSSAHSPQQQVTLWFATQMGKTEVLYNAVMQRIHTDPQDMMMVQPTLQDAKDHSSQRFLPTILQTPAMLGRVAVNRSRDESTSWRSRSIAGGFTMFFGGANSASSLSSKPVGFAACDEIDQYPADVDNQGPPLGLVSERMSNFSNRKLIVSSTCTIKGASAIETEYAKSDQRKYHVPCPHCGERQILLWGQKEGWGLQWQKTPSGKARPDTAVYICRHHGCVIAEHAKTGMLQNGIWVPDAPGAAGGKHAGFWINKLYSPLGWKSWPMLVEEWETSIEKQRTGDSAPLKKFKNTSLAETWEDTGSGADHRALAARAEDYPMDIVPRGGLMLVMGGDTQPDRIELRVYAYGRGEESWLVSRHIIYGDPNLDEGTEGSPWDRVTEIRRTPLMHVSGSQMFIEATVQDTGGHNANAVYAYCRNHAHAHVLAAKGHSQANKPVIGKPSLIDVTWRGKTAARSLKLWMIGTDTAKHLLYGRMRMTNVGPGYVHVPKALVTTDEFEQMTAARLLPVTVQGKQSMRWVTPHGKREEGGDCMVYAYAAACYLGIQNYREPGWARREQRYAPVNPDLFNQQQATQTTTEPAPNVATPSPANTHNPVPPRRAPPGRQQPRGVW